MKLLQYKKGEDCALAIESPRGTLDVAACAKELGLSAPATMLELAKSGKEGLALLQAIEQSGTALVGAPLCFAPAMTGMGKIICVGLNYAKHAKESDMPIPTHPVLFNKFASSLGAHEQDIFLPRDTEQYDYEAELVIVIGKSAKNVSREEAAGCILGYATGNDLSIRELQLGRGGQWMVGKVQDGFGPVGPYIVTADAVDAQNLRIESRVNGELRQSSNTGDMIFPCDTLVSYISQYMSLEPGDLIFTGTPEGVMLGYPEDKRAWLKAGDCVEIEIEGLGVLRNRLV